jgi:hypothetical protein
LKEDRDETAVSIGVALQAEHDDAAQRAAAPLLALWREERLAAVSGLPAAGYGGDIAFCAGRFVVSAPRAGCVLAWNATQGWSAWEAMLEPCALAVQGAHVWCGQVGRVAAIEAGVAATAPVNAATPRGLRLDNHACAA